MMETKFKVGDRIIHYIYGKGEILETFLNFQKEPCYTVHFSGFTTLVVGNQGMQLQDRTEDYTDMLRKAIRIGTENMTENNKNTSTSKGEDQNVTSAPKKICGKDNVKAHKDIVLGLNELYAKKNADYGDSFHESYLEEGMAMPRIRLSDKLSRFKSLTKSGKQEVKDESIRDTLLDLANYAIMTILELDREAADKAEKED